MRPDHLSASRLGTYLTCPRKYRFRYVDRLPPERLNAHLAFGRAVHATITWWFEQCRLDRPPDREQLGRMFRADWWAEASSGLLDLDGKPPQAYLRLGEQLLWLFAERFRLASIPAAVEQAFQVPLYHPRTQEPLPVPLVGIFDFTTSDLVGEIKTCARRTNPKQWWLQLAAYSFAFRQMNGHRPRLLLVELIKGRAPAVELLEVSVSDREERWFLDVTAEVLRSIEGGAFHPCPGWECSRCEYYQACRGMP